MSGGKNNATTIPIDIMRRMGWSNEIVFGPVGYFAPNRTAVMANARVKLNIESLITTRKTPLPLKIPLDPSLGSGSAFCFKFISRSSYSKQAKGVILVRLGA